MVRYIVLYGWDRFRGWEVLKFFLAKGEKAHVKGVARALKISPGTAQDYLVGYEKQGILTKERSANAINYRLAETPLTLELKKAYFVSLLSGFIAEFEKENPYVATLALYGSHAKGTYDLKSDIDLIAISQEKKPGLKAVQRLEEKLGKDAGFQAFTPAEWGRMLRQNDSFAVAVSKNHIILYGAEL